MPVSALALAVLAALLMALTPRPSAQAQAWDRLVDTVILKTEPADVDGNTTVDYVDHHLADEQGTTEDDPVIFDEALKRLRSAGGPIRLVEIVHAEDILAGGEIPASGAVIRADISTDRGCTFFTDPTGLEHFGQAITGVSDAAGRFLGPGAVPPGAYPPDLPLWPNSHTGRSPQQDYGFSDIWVDTYCEEQAIITIRAGYQDTVGPLPPDEQITINWVSIEAAKQPQIRWAGEEIVLEKRWALPDAYFPNADADGDTTISEPEDVCPMVSSYDADGDGDTDWDDLVALDLAVDGGTTIRDHRVRYDRFGGSPGGIVGGYADSDGDGYLDSPALSGDEPDGTFSQIDVQCHSKALYTSEDSGEADVEALLIESRNTCPAGWTPGAPNPGGYRGYSCSGGSSYSEYLVNKHAFLVLYLRIYQVKLTNVAGARSGHDAGTWQPEPMNPDSDTQTDTLSVSDDALLRVRVKGWFRGGDPSPRGDVCIDMDGDGDGSGFSPGEPYPPSLGACADPSDQLLSHGFWVLPDDLPALAGPFPGLIPSWDVMDDPGDDVSSYPANVIGLKSALDSHDLILRPNVPCTEPWCLRKTILPDGEITTADATMPPLKITAQIADPADAGLLKGANKVADLGLDNAYSSIMNPYEPEIAPFVNNGGYDWDSWACRLQHIRDMAHCPPQKLGLARGPYGLFDLLAILPAPGPLTNTGLGNQAGQSADDPTHPRKFQFYTDNRGEAFFFANGYYNLSFDECNIESPDSPECSPGDVVGASDITVIGDYPYFRKHPAVLSNPVEKTWTWGGAPVGGKVELRAGDAGSATRALGGSGSSAPDASLVGAGAVVAALALAGGAWCTRRRWLR